MFNKFKLNGDSSKPFGFSFSGRSTASALKKSLPRDHGSQQHIPNHSLPNLPEDVFLIITKYLEPNDIVRCQRVSHSWYDVFTNPVFLNRALRWNFSQARETRSLKELNDLGPKSNPSDPDVENKDLACTHLFNKVAARYDALKAGKPRSISRITTHCMAADGDPDWYKYQNANAWGRYLRSGRPVHHYEHRESPWTYNDALIVYPDAGMAMYAVLDLESNSISAVPFDLIKRYVRHVEVRDKVCLCGIPRVAV